MDEKYILADLGSVAEIIQSKIEKKFTHDDIQLSTGFKEAFSNYATSAGSSVEYMKTTVIISNSAGQKIYAPNQWFVLAAYAVEFVQEIIKYRNLTEELLDTYKNRFIQDNGRPFEKKDIYKSLKTDELSKFKDIFIDSMTEMLQKDVDDKQIVENNVKLLYRFVSDDKWWYGGKGIERTNDFYVSPILGILNLVNASQSYVATITYAYVNDEKLRRELSTMVLADSSEILDEDGKLENEYQRAARILNEYILESGIVYEKTEDELTSILDEFRRKFAPERLMELSDEDLLREMFYTAEQTNDSMCYWLEFQKECRSQFGSVTGGTSLKFGLYQNKEGEWITGSPAKKEIISFDEAIQIGKSIRDKLARGVEIIEDSTLDDVSDYEELHDKLVDALGNFATNNWVHKYFYMMFPDRLATWHSEDWQKHGLRGLLINPSSKTYGRSGQIAIVAKYAGLMATHLGEVFYDKFGGIKQFCRLGTSDNDGNYAENWRKQHIAAIGWPAVGSLENYSQSNAYTGKDIVKKALVEKMQDEYYPNDVRIASRKAGELQTFYKTTKDSIFVMMDGEKLLALCDDVGNYTYDENNVHMPHNKSVTWHCCFDEEERLPKKAEGHMTSCVELKDDANLLYLYRKYYYDLSEEGEEEMSEIKLETEEYIEPNYNTGFECDFERNRIVFGAPGTGKSYKLKQESEELLDCAENHMERVTFHTDYSYSQFVG